MKRIIKLKYRIVVLFIEIFTFILIAFLAYNFVVTPKGKKTFYLHSSDIETLSSTLEKNGYKIFFIDKLLMKFIALPKKGWYSIKDKNKGRFFFFDDLYTQKIPSDKLMNIKVFAGETKEELSKRIANDMKLDKQKLLQQYKYLSRFEEGDILAGKYTVAREADNNTTMDYLFQTSNDNFEKFSKTYCQKYPDFYELKVLIIIASIIQKESNAIDEMPLISSVIYNRLEKNMRLQMDGTLNYGKYAHTIVTPERIKTDISPYNTYKYKGLPPAPLSSVSLDALKAAYNPKSSNYIFFMLTKDGTHTFADTYEEHLKNIRTFRKSQEDKNITEESNTTKNTPLPIKHTTEKNETTL